MLPVRLLSNRSQMTSKCGKSKKVAHEAPVSLMFLAHIDVLYDLLLNRRTATWNLFVSWLHDYICLMIKEVKKWTVTPLMRLSSNSS